MEAKLIKTEVNYLLKNEEGVIIASTSIKKGISSLSKQNCDELFGAVDVDKLADDYFKGTNENAVLWRRIDFKDGFNKAIELNKDKLFTLENIEEAFAYGQLNQVHNQKYFSGSKTYIQSLQQPTEINVEIVMDICGDKVYAVPEPKLDSEGCLILKRK